LPSSLRRPRVLYLVRKKVATRLTDENMAWPTANRRMP
jgi:hypothetical protein